ncbi:MAG: ComEC/Rec2 family competence protein [Oscillospiraceae bacterium]
MREAIPLYTEHYKAVVRVEKIGDKDLYTTFLANLDDIELISNGDKLRLTVKFNDANGIKTLYNYSKNVFIEAEAVSEFELLGKSQDLVTSFKTLQNKLSNNITNVIQGENGYIAAAMSVGDKAKLSSLTKYQFRCAGISHMLVVSGMHLATIGGLAFYLGEKLFASRKIGAVLGIVITVSFMLLTGITPSVVRAGIALLVLYFGILLSRIPDTLTSLGFAALILCVQNPFAAIDLGMLLSFAATLGVLLANYFTKHYCKKEFVVKHHLIFKLFSAICVPIGASIATLPILVGFGGAVSILSVIFNLIAVPLLPIIALSAFCIAFLANITWLYPIVILLKFICSAAIAIVVWLTQKAQSIPFNLVYISGIGTFFCILALYILVFFAFRYKIKFATIYLTLFLISCLVFEIAISKDIVSIEPAIISGNPAVTIYKNGKAAVIYSASVKASNLLYNSMLKHNISNAECVINLRRSEQDDTSNDVFGAKICYNVEQSVLNNTIIKVFDDVLVYIKRQNGGITACIDVAGYKVELSSGKLDYSEYAPVDVCIAGKNEPVNLDAKYYFCDDKMPKWLDKSDDKRYKLLSVYSIDIRPNKAVRMCHNFYGYE